MPDWEIMAGCVTCGAAAKHACVLPSGEELYTVHERRLLLNSHAQKTPDTQENDTPGPSTRSRPSPVYADPRRLLTTDDARALVGVLQPRAVVAWLTMWAGTGDSTRETLSVELQRLWRVTRTN